MLYQFTYQVYKFMGLWVYRFTGLRVYGFTGLRVYGFCDQDFCPKNNLNTKDRQDLFSSTQYLKKEGPIFQGSGKNVF